MRTAHAVGMLCRLDRKTHDDSGALAKIMLFLRSMISLKLAAKLTPDRARRMASAQEHMSPRQHCGGLIKVRLEFM